MRLQGLDAIDMVKFISRKSKQFQAVSLNDLEILFSKYPGVDKQLFIDVRKLFLDGQNNFARAVVKLIFGDIEHLIK